MNKLYPTLSKYILADKDALVVDTQRSHGSWIVDENGKEYLDCFSQFASQPLGWNHQKVRDRSGRLFNVAIHNLANSDVYCSEYAQFVETFAKACPDFKYHFFIAGGTLGVENALKVAFDWKSKKLDLNDDESNNLDVIHLKDAFHGRSGYTLSLTNTHLNKTEFFPKFNWTRVVNPKLCGIWPSNQVIALKEIEEAMQDNNVAAFIMETIQGEGGDGHFDKTFFAEVRKLCDKYEVMFILDEVQCGVGLTGKMWAYEHFDVKPDLIAFGKKAQVCGCSSTGRVDEIPDNVFHVPSRINSTWGGNIVDMVRSTIYLEIMQEDNLIANAKMVGDYFKLQLEKLGLDNLRGKGLMIAFDFDTGKERDDFLNRLNPEMIAMPCGNNSVRLRPHLTFGQTEADCAVDFIRKVL